MKRLPEGWEQEKLSNVLHETENIDPTSQPEVNFQYIDVSSISRKTFSIESASQLKGKEAPSRARKLVRTGDVLFATIRPTLQRIAIVPETLNGEVCSTGYYVFRPKELISNRFLYYYLFTDAFMSEMERRQKGASYPAVNNADVQEQVITFPPLPEQKRIVSILDEAFEGIDQAIANTEKNLANACELFDSYLNNIFTQKGKGWTNGKLSDFCDVRDGTHDSPKYIEQGIPFVTQKNIRGDGLSFDDTKFISRIDHDKFHKRSNVKIGDILISMIGVNRGMSCLVDDERTFSIKNVGLIKSTNNINMVFLLYYLKSNLAKAYVDEESRGGAQPFVGLTNLRNFPVFIAPKNQQGTIVEKLNDVQSKKRCLENIYQEKLNSLKELKQSILQKAFSGELTADSVQ